MSSKKLDDMTEAELARFYEDNRGDLSLWKEKPIQIRVSEGGPQSTFAVPLTGKEIQFLYEVAKEEGVSLSDFIRHAALDAAKAHSVKRAKATAPRKD